MGIQNDHKAAFAIFVFVLMLASLAISVVNLTYLNIAGNPFVVLNCGIAFLILIVGNQIGITITPTERKILIISLLTLPILGGFSYNQWYGLSFDLNAIAAALVLLAAYIIARFLHQSGWAYMFALVGFVVFAVPSTFIAFTGGLLREIVESGSENYMTSWLIITSLAMCSARIAEGKPPPIWPVALTFLIALTQYTRASIVVSFISLVGILYIRLGWKLTAVLTLAALLALIPFYETLFYRVVDVVEGTKFGQRGLDSPRWEMWMAYIDYQTLGSFLLGTNTDYVPVISEFGGNPHSTFVRFHAYFGILPFVAYLAIIFRKALVAHHYLLIPLGLILVRAATDILFIGTVLDVFFMIALVPVLMTSAPVRKVKRQRRIVMRRV